eukprot:Nitzschia sp. Nitz4//scaffold262_size27079//2271//3104//NITZ4_008217-RA/size27079-processed-gene-0.1-mRNA-1//1//CDS//3329544742//5009//frame0
MLRTFSSEDSSAESQALCDVIQGPSLLRTPVPRPNPSLLYLPGLRSLPFWTAPDYRRIAYGDPTLTHVVNHLEANVETIRQEYLQVAPGMRSDYEATDHGVAGNPSKTGPTGSTLHDGVWEWHSYMNKGNVQGHFVFHFRQTASILQSLRDDGLLFEGTPFGFCFFSTLHAGASIQAHTAPMNFRLRIHLPLIVPTTDDEHEEMPSCGIRVGNMVRPWTQDKALVLDDSYDHEVWNRTDQNRVLLLVDIWHPDVSLAERKEIIQMFQDARQQGLWKR